MGSPNARSISLSLLGDGLPELSPGMCKAMEEAGAVCFEGQGHSSGVNMIVEANVGKPLTEMFEVDWGPVTDTILRTWADSQEATEYGASGVAILLVRELTEYTAVERARKDGGGFDYWLGLQDAGDDLPFQHKARLEVSGTLSGDDTRVRARVKSKLKQTNRSDGTYPAFAAVVRFSKPDSRLVKK